jgi:hypothetical protein
MLYPYVANDPDHKNNKCDDRDLPELSFESEYLVPPTT